VASSGLRKIVLGACLWPLAGLAWAADSSSPAASEDAYPAAAQALNLPGRATLDCTAAADGSVNYCKVASEDPPEWGFGAAALKLAPTINVGPGAAGRRVQVPVSFRLDDRAVEDPLLKAPGFLIPDEQVQWLKRPSAQDFAITYPSTLIYRNDDGLVTFACRVSSEGKLVRCVTLSVKPERSGLAKVMPYMESTLQMAPRLRDGRAVENGVVKLKFRWTMRG
jgi:TonB family protein